MLTLSLPVHQNAHVNKFNVCEQGYSNFGNNYYVPEAILPSTAALYFDLCQRHYGDISMLQHVVLLPTFLSLERSSNCIDRLFTFYLLWIYWVKITHLKVWSDVRAMVLQWL